VPNSSSFSLTRFLTHFPNSCLMKNIPFPSRILNLLAAGCLLALSAGSALAAAPEIGVKQGTTSIGDGGSHAFASIAVGSSGSSVTFTIANTGDADLTGFAISKTGTNAADFSVTAVSPSAPVAGPAGTTTSTALATGETGSFVDSGEVVDDVAAAWDGSTGRSRGAWTVVRELFWSGSTIWAAQAPHARTSAANPRQEG
jgi:hypothetical protein